MQDFQAKAIHEKLDLMAELLGDIKSFEHFKYMHDNPNVTAVGGEGDIEVDGPSTLERIAIALEKIAGIEGGE